MCGYKPCGQQPHSLSLTVFCCVWRGGGWEGEAQRSHLRLDGLAPWEPLASSGRPTHSTAPQARTDLPHPSFCSPQGRPGGPSAPHIPHSLHREPVLPPQPPTASLPRCQEAQYRVGGSQCQVCRQTNLGLDSRPAVTPSVTWERPLTSLCLDFSL